MKISILKSQRFVIPVLLLCSHLYTNAQNGPGGVGTTDGTSSLKLWLRADKGVFADAGSTPAVNGQAVQQWNDQSGNNLHATQVFEKYRPVFASASFNGFPALTFSSLGTWLNAALDISPSVNPNITVIAVASHTAISGTAPYSKIWGHDNGAFDRTIGYDPRTGTTFTYFDGTKAADFLYFEFIPLPSADEPFVTTAIYTQSNFEGYLKGILGATDLVSNGDGEPVFTIGAINSSGSEPWSGNIVELMVYDTVLSRSEFVNIENYLSAKYGTTDLGNDIYRMDSPQAGDFDYDVTGVHYFYDSPAPVTTARGTGLLTISNASNLFPGGSYLVGHDNGSLAPVTTDLQTSIANRLGRIWAGTENDGDIGTVDLAFDLPNLVVSDPANLRLLVDRNNNGRFADEADGDGVISGFTKSGDTYTINVNMGDGQRFTIGSISTILLPVSLRSIIVQREGKYNKVQWKTEREVNFKYFDVQRSEDGVNFSRIGEVQSRAGAGAVKEYFFVDERPLATNYYRLRFVDQNGNSAFSPIVKIFTGSKRFAISPNPSTNMVSITGLNGTVTLIELYDNNGKRLEHRSTTELQSTLYLTKYPTGTYYIRLKTGKDVFTEMIIKQ